MIAGKTKLVIDFGGGIKTRKDVDIVFNSGAAIATIGSIAVKDEELFAGWLIEYGPDKFLLGADIRDEKITVNGWIENTPIPVYEFIQKYSEKKLNRVFCTDVSKDGLLQGPSVDLYKNIIARFPALHLIASGGVSSMEDVYELRDIGCAGVIVGKAIYEGRISISELSNFNYGNP
jgi:phosphoribosylformimino-5-aminoimidazole carboxamide ribotide isomerase